MPDEAYRSLILTTTSGAYCVAEPPHVVAMRRAQAVQSGTWMTLKYADGALAGERFYLNPAMIVAITPTR